MTTTGSAGPRDDVRARLLDTIGAAMAALSDPVAGAHTGHDEILAGLRRALAETPARGDGADVRAAVAVRTAVAHLAAEQVEDAFIALQHARDQFPGRRWAS